jgi:hypothetical protein
MAYAEKIRKELLTELLKKRRLDAEAAVSDKRIDALINQLAVIEAAGQLIKDVAAVHDAQQSQSAAGEHNISDDVARGLNDASKLDSSG